MEMSILKICAQTQRLAHHSIHAPKQQSDAVYQTNHMSPQSLTCPSNRLAQATKAVHRQANAEDDRDGEQEE